MVRLFESTDTNFSDSKIGICQLRDCKECIVSQNIDGTFELMIEYPVDGEFFNEIKEDRIIVVKPNDYTEEQAFRIYEINKTLEATATINAQHISYDIIDYTIMPLTINLSSTADNRKVRTILEEIFSKTNNDYKHIIYPDCNFNFILDSSIDDLTYDGTEFKIESPTNLRELIFGDDYNSLLGGIDKLIAIQDNFDITFKKEVNEDRGYSVRYANNMTELDATVNYSETYSDIYAFYKGESSSKTTKETRSWGKAHINDHIAVSPPTEEEPNPDWIEGAQNWPPEVLTEQWLLTEDSSMERNAPLSKVSVQSAVKNAVGLEITGPEEIIHHGELKPNPYLGRVFRKFNTKFDGILKKYWTEITNTDPYAESNKGYTYVTSETNTTDNYKITDLKDYEFPEGEEDPNLDTTTGIYHLKDGVRRKLKVFDITDYLGEDEYSQDGLYMNLKKYLELNDISEVKLSIGVEFVKLSDFDEYNEYKELEHVELYDMIAIKYEDIGVDMVNKVISYEYDCILERYNRIEIGEEPESIASTVVTKGSNISDLTNNMSFATEDFSLKSVAKQAVGFTKDQIKSLIGKKDKSSSESTVNSGSLELNTSKGIKILSRDIVTTSDEEDNYAASLFLSILQESICIEGVDELVADLLVAENAVVKDTLYAGNIKVKGHIEADSGYIAGFHIVNTETDPTKPAKPVLTTNIEKTSLYSLTEGLYLNNDGISFYDSNTTNRVIIDKMSGVYSSNYQFDPFNDSEYEAASGKKGSCLVSTLYSYNTNIFTPTSGNKYIVSSGLDYIRSNNIFLQFIDWHGDEDRYIPADSYIDLVVRRSPQIPYDFLDKVTLKMVYITQVVDSIHTSIGQGNLAVRYNSSPDEDLYGDKPKWTIRLFNNTTSKVGCNLLLVWESDRND